MESKKTYLSPKEAREAFCQEEIVEIYVMGEWRLYHFDIKGNRHLYWYNNKWCCTVYNAEEYKYRIKPKKQDMITFERCERCGSEEFIVRENGITANLIVSFDCKLGMQIQETEYLHQESKFEFAICGKCGEPRKEEIK